MALESDHCANIEIYCTVEYFLIRKELQSLFTYKLQMKSWTETVLLAMCSNTLLNLVAYMCKDELKRESLSLSTTLNHNPRCNISSLCDISVNLLRKYTLLGLTLSLSSINEQNTVGRDFVFCPVTTVTSLIIQNITFRTNL